jgi:curved DNA-binding protein CbpA
MDPYKVLGVSANASDEEIKTAYRALAKKYHPDNYDKSPLSDLAAEKMKEVNEAYELIMSERKNGGKRQNKSQWPGSNAHNYQDSRYKDLRKMIAENRFADAERVLDSVPSSARDAEWYFLKGSLLYRKGWLEDAYRHFESACRMDPYNREYSAALNQMMNQRSGNFMNYSNMSGGPMGCSMCDICSSFMCADALCNCFGPNC